MQGTGRVSPTYLYCTYTSERGKLCVTLYVTSLSRHRSIKEGRKPQLFWTYSYVWSFLFTENAKTLIALHIVSLYPNFTVYQLKNRYCSPSVSCLDEDNYRTGTFPIISVSHWEGHIITYLQLGHDIERLLPGLKKVIQS